MTGSAEDEERSPRIYADFMKTDDSGRLVLTTIGTRLDLEMNQLDLAEGMRMTFWEGSDRLEDGGVEDIVAEGLVHFDKKQGCWVAEIDPGSLRHETEDRSWYEARQRFLESHPEILSDTTNVARGGTNEPAERQCDQ